MRWILALSIMLGACGYGGKVCSVVDLAHSACEKLPIRYLAPDGREVVVYVPRSELTAVAARHAR